MERLTASLVVLLTASILIPAIAHTEVKGYTAFNSAVNAEPLNEFPNANLTSLTIVVFVNSTIFDGVRESLNQYRNDLKNSGFEDVIVLNWSESNPHSIRETLQQLYSNSSLAGALLVGDLPAAEYEMFSQWNYERFPIDLYYMDLDGEWVDNDEDGILDEHIGKEVAPEIWVGRIKTSNLGGNETSLINSYFKRNHAYRNGTLSLPRRALIYIDDDWVDSATMDKKSVTLVYDEVTVVAAEVTTNVTDYKERLKQGYEWVHLRSHGTWDRHQFWIKEGNVEVIYSTEYSEIDPNALFYQLFICKAARFTEPNYLAGSIVFNTNRGLLAIGTTKMGGMLMYWTFYDALASGKTIGDAFKEWFIKWGEGKFGLGGASIGRKWFYGLTIIGDPTLQLRWLGKTEIEELQRLEEEVVNDLPLVKNLREQVNGLGENYSSLMGEYSNLQEAHSAIRDSYNGLETQVADIRNILYFFLLTTTLLLAANIYITKTRPKSKQY